MILNFVFSLSTLPLDILGQHVVIHSKFSDCVPLIISKLGSIKQYLKMRALEIKVGLNHSSVTYFLSAIVEISYLSRLSFPICKMEIIMKMPAL